MNSARGMTLLQRAATVVLSLLLLQSAAAAMGRPPPPAGGPSGINGGLEILFVADGDTLRARSKGRSEWIRLLRIDTPEKNEEGYGEARSALVEMVEDGAVTITFEKQDLPDRDGYGRLLAYLFAGGKNINVEMVRAGWSPFWRRYGEGRFAEAFRQAEGEARAAGRGLWGRTRGRPSGAPPSR